MSIKKIALILILTIVFSAAGTAQTAYTLFNQGNEAFQKRDYPVAIELYKKSLTRNQSMSQHLNIANAYYHNKQLGYAILHYMKALTISPNDAEVTANLNIAREAASVQPPQYTSLQKIAHVISANMWTLIAMVSFWGIAMLFVLPRVYNWKAVPVKTFLSLFITLMAVSAVALYAYHTERKMGVILSPDTPLFVAPSDASPTNIFLQEGSLAHVQKKHEGFLFIKTSAKQKGWVKDDDFAEIWH